MTETTCGSCDRPTAGAILCDRCCKTLAICLANAQAYYEDLGTVATKATRYGSGSVTMGTPGKEQPLVADARFLEVTGDGTQVRWDVWNSVTTWCRIVMEESRRVSGPCCGQPCLHTTCAAIKRTAWPRNTVRSMFAYFDRQFRWIVRSEWAPEFLDEMLDNERRMRKMIDRPADRWYAGKCSDADDEGNICTAELYALAGAAIVICPACAFEHDVTKRRDFLLAEARAYLVTATEAARALISWTDYDGTEDKLVDRIRRWRDRDQLEVADVTSLNGRDRHLYRLGDVQDLLVKAAQHAQEKRVRSA
jgi:hypothetical protein